MELHNLKVRLPHHPSDVLVHGVKQHGRSFGWLLKRDDSKLWVFFAGFLPLHLCTRSCGSSSLIRCAVVLSGGVQGRVVPFTGVENDRFRTGRFQRNSRRR